MGKKWTEEEIQFLKFAYPNKDFTVTEIANVLNRNKSSISTKANSLGLKIYKEYIPEGYKKCSKCESIIPLSFFTKRGDYKTRYRSWCKECRKIEYRDYKNTNSVPTNSVPTNSVPTNSVPKFKKCKDCNKDKPVSEFYKNKNNKDKYDNFCKMCSNIRKEKSVLKRMQEKGW